MQAVAPHAGVGGSEITIVDLEHGVVVPQPDIRYAHTDLGYEVAMLAQSTFMEHLHLAHGYVQAAQESPLEIQGYQFFPLIDLVDRPGIVAVIGAEKYVPDERGRVSKVGIAQGLIDGLFAPQSHHEQST